MSDPAVCRKAPTEGHPHTPKPTEAEAAIARVRALCDAENRRIAERTTLGSNPREWAALLRVQDVEAAIDGTEAGRCVCGQPGAQGVTHRQDGPCYVTGSDNG